MHCDYLIIGQGLAGSLLAWQLIQAGQKVMLVDNGNPCAASRVAAGLINPVTGKRMVKEGNAKKYLSVAREYYTSLSKQFGVDFIHEKPMLRLFDTEGIKQAWEKRYTDKNYQAFVGEALSPEECGYNSGGFIQQQTAYLLTASLLSYLRRWLSEHLSLIETQFECDELELGKPLHWHTYSADRIIFCEGARVVKNPWFRELPMQPAQGEILTLHTKEKLPEWIVNGGNWLLPLKDGMFKVGATYIWPGAERPLDEKISEAGKQVLLKALPKLFPLLKEYELIEHAVGIRPNSQDKRPLIGFHPLHENMAVFNGFGSKGSMLIPYYVQHFANVLLKGLTLNEDVDIKRVLT